MERLKVGAIGFGLRGKSVLENVLVPIYESGKIEITAICELSDEALLWGKEFLKGKTNKEPHCFKDYRRLLDSGIDAVVILCGWRDHVDIACEALSRGIAVGMEDYLEKFEEHPLKNKKFAHGDMITTTLRCADGQTITLTLNTTLPSPYSRKLGVFGTKGCYNEDNDSIFINPDKPSYEPKREELWGNAEKYEEEYLHEYWKGNKAFGSHGGMDGMVFTAFFDSVINGTEPPIDVYDGALMMAITPLSEESVALGGTAVAVPDFTNGRFATRPPLDPDNDI